MAVAVTRTCFHWHWWRRDESDAGAAPDSRWWWAAAGVLLAGVLSGFVDPHFGLNVGSGRALASILVSFVLETMVGWLVVVWAVRRVHAGRTTRPVIPA